MRCIRLPIILLVILSIFVGCGSKPVMVDNVTDGDSFIMTNGEEVRLIGIDAPEATKPGADIAKVYLENLILGKELRFEYDATRYDDYNRSLCYVFVNNTFVNGAMVKNGYAIVRYGVRNKRYEDELKASQKNAEEYKKGLWAFGNVFQPSEIPAIPKEDAISWQDAANYYGEIKLVEGKIVKAYNSGKACYLNFHQDYKKHFSLVIFADDFKKFPEPPEEYYLNKIVRTRGLIKEYQGSPEIVITDPSQIEIVK
ncbi:MAG TPA: hypothetical protein ENH85_00680 [Candidatus Scalindua sp.]|nr:hypothetical protein [Candidatus Scalindua sp.]